MFRIPKWFEKEMKIKFQYYIFITSLCIVCFYNSLDNGFVHDDIFAIKNNKDIQPEKTSLWSLFSNDFWGKKLVDPKSHKSFRPLCTVTFRLNYMVNQLDPFGYHLVNLILHISVCNLFMFVVSTVVFGNEGTQSVVAAALFACHPVHVEAVTGVVGRADVLSCLLGLLSFYFYNRHLLHEKNKPAFLTTSLFLSFLCGSCAFFVKEHSVMIFLVCVGYDVLKNRKIISRIILPLLNYKQSSNEETTKQDLLNLIKRIIFVLFSFLSLVQFRVYLMGYSLPLFKEEDNPASFSPHLMTRVLTYLYLLVFNLKLMIYPSTLCYDWQIGSIPLVETFSDPRNLETVLMVLVFTVLLRNLITWFIRAGQKEESDDDDNVAIAIGVLFMVIPFLPASNLFIRVGFVVAERILYIPSLGFTILVAIGFTRLLVIVKETVDTRRLLFPILLIVLLSFSLKTITYNRVWNSRETLFKSGVQTLSHNAKAHYNYANFLKDENRTKDAIYHYRKAVRLYPAHSSSHNNLGTLLEVENNLKEAKEHFQEAIKNTPGHYRAMLNLANLYRKESKHKDAYDILTRCLELKPDYFECKYLLADTLNVLGQSKEALRLYEELTSQQKNNLELQQNFAALLQDLGLFDRAISIYTSLLARNPKNPSHLSDLAIVYQKAGEPEMTVKLYERAINYHPAYTKAYQNLAALHFNNGDFDKAKTVYESLKTHASPTSEHLRNYAIVLFSLGMQQDAIINVDKLIIETPNDVNAHNLLVNFLMELGNNEKASVAIERALKLFPTNQNILLHKGNLKRNLKEFDTAKSIYKSLLVANKKNFDALLNLGTVYHIQKEYKSAMEMYKSASKIRPENSIILENMEKLKRLMNKE